MPPYLRRVLQCVVLVLAGQALCSPRAGADEAAPPEDAAIQQLADESARDLVRRLKEAEARSGFRRMVYDEGGKIRLVYLYSSVANDENLRAASHLPDLQGIRISAWYSGISGEALGELSRLHHLEKIEMRNRPITLEFGMALGKISSLRTLTLTGSDMEAGAIGFLGALSHLTTLELRSCRLNDAAVAALTQLRQLETLDLSYTGLSAANLDVLATLPHLKRLTVTGTSITEEEVLNSKLAAKVAVKGAKVKPKPQERENLVG
jgi:hypothetical protein